MTNDGLKAKFQTDLEILKHLELGIIPAGKYYRDVFLGCFLVYLIFLSVQLMACFLATNNSAWDYVAENQQVKSKALKSLENDEMFKRLNLVFEEHNLEEKHPDATPEEMRALKEEKRNKEEAERLQRKNTALTEAQEQEDYYHLVRVTKMVGGVIVSSLFFMFFFIGKVKTYVIFKHQIKPKLKTGDYLTTKIKLAFKLYFGVFGTLVLMTIPLFDQDMTFFAGIAAFIFSAIIASIGINMEASRIGISVLSTAIASFFDSHRKMGISKE